MRRLIITDLHRKDPRNFIEKISKLESIDKVVCLGDIDSPKVIEYFLEDEVRNTFVIGNHDYFTMIDCCNILKGEMPDKTQKANDLDGTVEDHWRDVDYWVNSKILREYAQKFLADSENKDRFQKVEKNKNGDLVYIHASLSEDPLIADEPFQLWARMQNIYGTRNDNVITRNFKKMRENNYWLMFRGHDWGQSVYSLGDKNNNFLRYKSIWDPSKDKIETILNKNKKHIVSFGIFACGQYGIFDDETLKLELCNPER